MLTLFITFVVLYGTPAVFVARAKARKAQDLAITGDRLIRDVRREVNAQHAEQARADRHAACMAEFADRLARLHS